MKESVTFVKCSLPRGVIVGMSSVNTRCTVASNPTAEDNSLFMASISLGDDKVQSGKGSYFLLAGSVLLFSVFIHLKDRNKDNFSVMKLGDNREGQWGKQPENRKLFDLITSEPLLFCAVASCRGL